MSPPLWRNRRLRQLSVPVLGVGVVLLLFMLSPVGATLSNWSLD